MSGTLLNATIDSFRGLPLRTKAELKRHKPTQSEGGPSQAIEGLARYTGYRCAHPKCNYYTRVKRTMMYEHQPVAHQRHAQSRSGGEPLWTSCILQTYFTAKGLIDYFVVADDNTGDIPGEDDQREDFPPDYGNRAKPSVLPVPGLSVASKERLSALQPDNVRAGYDISHDGAMEANGFAFNEEHRVIVCRRCGTCLAPAGIARWKAHLYREPHQLKGAILEMTIKLLSPYASRIRPLEALRQERPSRRSPSRHIDGLDVYQGYICTCNEASCDFVTRRLVAMHKHMPTHGMQASQHDAHIRPLWRACKLQTYFTAKGLIDYFVVKGENQQA